MLYYFIILLLQAFVIDAYKGIINTTTQPFKRTSDVSLHAWVDNSVSAKIPASLETTWEMFTDLEKHPLWSPWLEEVQYQQSQKNLHGISLWTLQALGMKFSWRFLQRACL